MRLMVVSFTVFMALAFQAAFGQSSTPRGPSPYVPTQVPKGLDPDWIKAQSEKISALPTAVVTMPVDLANPQGRRYGGYWGFGLGVYVPTQYQTWSSPRFAKAMAESLQWALDRVVSESGKFKMLPPYRGRLTKNLELLRQEYVRDLKRKDPDLGGPEFIYTVVFTVLNEREGATIIDGRGIVNIARAAGIGLLGRRGRTASRIIRIADSTIGRSGSVRTDRDVILMASVKVAHFDADGRLLANIGPFVGVVETSMKEFSAVVLPGLAKVSDNRSNVTRLIVKLARAVTWDPMDPQLALLSFLERRGKLTKADRAELDRLRQARAQLARN